MKSIYISGNAPLYGEVTIQGSKNAALPIMAAALLIPGISVLKNCADDPKELAQIVAERTRSQVVQVIGKKIVLYKEGKDEKKKIILP